MNPLSKAFFIKSILMVGLLCGGVSIFAQDFVIPEPALQNAIARSLGVSERSLSKSLVEKKLLRLQANDLAIRDLTGLEHATNLESLVLRDNLIDDLSPIQNLSKLKNLDLSGNRLTSLRTLAPLAAPSLRILNLSRNRLLGLSGIDGFRALAQLDVSSNALIDLEGSRKVYKVWLIYMLRVISLVEWKNLLTVIVTKNLMWTRPLPMRAGMERGIPIH